MAAAKKRKEKEKKVKGLSEKLREEGCKSRDAGKGEVSKEMLLKGRNETQGQRSSVDQKRSGNKSECGLKIPSKEFEEQKYCKEQRN